MKIYSNSQRDRNLDKFVGTDYWILMRAPSMHVFYVKLIRKYPSGKFQVCYVPWTDMLYHKSSASWWVDRPRPEAFTIGWGVESWEGYDFVVEEPLNILTTDEILDYVPE